MIAQHFSFLNTRRKAYFFLVFLIISIKILLIPTYHSTDLEVHRNWLTMTQQQKLFNTNDKREDIIEQQLHNIDPTFQSMEECSTALCEMGQFTKSSSFYSPIPYFDSEICSEHTLDYPMLFLYFQNILTMVYKFVFQIISLWLEKFWSIKDSSPRNDFWTEWNLWTMKEMESVSLLSDVATHCQGFSNLYSNRNISYSKGSSQLPNNPFVHLKALLLERRGFPNLSYQYPLPFLLFMRASVIVSDIIYYLALYFILIAATENIASESSEGIVRDCEGVTLSKVEREKPKKVSNANKYTKAGKLRQIYQQLSWRFIILLLVHPSLLFLDHIHFQYNGMLLGILLFSMYFALRNRLLVSAALMSVLICFKHLYIYVLPAYIVILLVFYVGGGYGKNLSITSVITKFTSLAIVTGSIPVLALLPLFYVYKDFKTPIEIILQIKNRLFPFHRGLTHSYWAPNFWALYNVIDKVLSILLKRHHSTASLTGGLVGLDQGTYAVLPTITPLSTIVLTLTFSFGLICIIVLRQGSISNLNQIFLKSCFHSSMSFFMFGWHVHEKAIVTSLIPLMLNDIFYFNQEHSHLGFCFQFIGTYSLFPLLFRMQELPIKYALFILYFVLIAYMIPEIQPKNWIQRLEVIICVFGVFLLELFSQLFHPVLLGKSFPFLPLMFTSLFCAIMLIYLWIRILYQDTSNSLY